MFLSGKRNTTGVWQKVQRVATIVILLFSLTGVENAMADMIETTETQIKQNVNNVKNDIKNLQNKLNDFAKQAGGIAQSEVIKPLVEDLKAELKKALKDPKNYNGENLEKIVKDLEEKGKDISAVKEIATDVRKTIKDIKNIATVIFTAPVGLSGGYGQTGLKIEMDPLTYKRKGAKEGSTSIKAKAEFQLPFSVSGDGGNTKIGFLGDINLIGENNSSKLFAYVENTNQVSSDEITYYPILEGKAELGVYKDSYIEVDCNGFKSMRLHGKFRFESSVLYKADPKTVTKEDSMLTADFDVNISDLEDILIEVSFDEPFKIRCTGDVVYKVTGVIADLSTVKNAENFQFPRGYRNPFKGSDEAYWTGFALKALEVNVEKELPFVKTLNAYNMLIDETGISGWFGAGFKEQDIVNNPAIGVSIDTLAVGIASNKIVGGTIGGDLTVKMLKDKKSPDKDKELKIDLNGTLYSDNNNNLCYSFEAKINKGEYDLPFLKESGTVISISEGTSISYQKENNPKYKPDDKNCKEDPYRRGFHFVINGNLSMDYSFLHVDNLQFQNLKFSTCEPYFGGGTFALNSAKSMNLGGLEIALNRVSVGLGVEEDEKTKEKTTSASIGADVTLKLIGDGKGVSVGTAFNCGASKKEKEKWQIGGFSVDKIMIDVDFSAFHLAGMIEQYGVTEEEQKALYGKGFKGSINLKLDMLNIDVDAIAQFGKTAYTASPIYNAIEAEKVKYAAGQNGVIPAGKEYKYWYVFAGVSGLKGVVIFPPSVMLEGVSLGLFSHMSYTMNQTTKEISRNYHPDASKKFGIQGGVKFFMAQESLIGAQVKLGLMINDHGGVSEVTLDGGIYMLGDNVQDAFVKGTVATKYDFEQSIFTCYGLAEMGVSYLKGTFNLDILSAPKNWHFYVGTNSSPVGLKFVDIIKTKSYFMLGHGVPTTLAPLDPRITELFGVTQSTASGKTAEMESGKGFAFGASICVDCGFKGFVYAGAALLGGLDVLVIRNQDGNCEHTKYRGFGRAYVYLDLGAGVKPRKKKFEFIDFVGSSKLYAEFPKPLYIEGDVAFKYSVLGGLFKGTVRTHFDAGKTCSNNAGSNYNSEGYKRPSFDIYDDQDNSILHQFDTDEEVTPEMIDAIEGLTPEQKEQMKKELENSGN